MRSATPFPTMRHMNGELVLALNVQTTGPNPQKHEVIQIGAVIADDWLDPIEIHRGNFLLTLIPQKPEIANVKSMAKRGLSFEYCCKHGTDVHIAAGLFVEWFESLGLKPGKKLQVLAFDAPVTMEFMRRWLGHMEYNRIFSPKHRCVKSVIQMQNDQAFFRSRKVPDYRYTKNTLPGLCTLLRVTNEMPNNALHDALATLECYRRMIGASW